jgi:hypothetical protein
MDMKLLKSKILWKKQKNLSKDAKARRDRKEIFNAFPLRYLCDSVPTRRDALLFLASARPPWNSQILVI